MDKISTLLDVFACVCFVPVRSGHVPCVYEKSAAIALIVTLSVLSDASMLAEREALEPVLSQNITQSQISINNQLITIIIKSKYYRISLAISIFGCIFGCRISNTPSHEHQTKHHFCT